MCERFAVWVDAALPLLDRHAGKVQRIDFDASHVFPVQVVADGDGHERTLPTDIPHHPFAIAVRERHQRGQRVQRPVDVRGPFGHQHDAKVRAIDGERPAHAVENAAAPRRQQAEADAIVLRQRQVTFGFDHLQIVQTSGEDREKHSLAAAEDQRPPSKLPPAIEIAAHVSHVPEHGELATQQ